MADPRNIDLYELYSESGHMGAKERRTRLWIDVSGVAGGTSIVLVERSRVESFPEEELLSETFRRWTIPAGTLVGLIQQHGTPVPET